jgi:PTS system nitrogen regulatory IIA component
MSSLSELINPQRTLCRVHSSSKKRVFEEVAAALAGSEPDVDPTEVISSLLAREKLGSTALGGGVAIPHCRLDSCRYPLGVLMTLEHPLDFDAPDEQPVDLLFSLLVPGEAVQEHLDLLADIARLFSRPGLCSALRLCDSDTELHQAMLEHID